MPAHKKVSRKHMVRVGITASLAVSALAVTTVGAASAQASETTHTASTDGLTRAVRHVSDNEDHVVFSARAVAANRGSDHDRDDRSRTFDRDGDDATTRTGSQPSVKSVRPAAFVPPSSMSQSSRTLQVSATATSATAAVAVAANVSPTTANSSPSTLSAPLATLRITEAYGVAGSRWSSGHHTGVDFAAAQGTSVQAVASGVVVKAGYDGAYGNDVITRTDDGKYVLFAHLSSITVAVNQTVTAGQQIGLSGATGNVTGPHLHLEVRTTPNYGSDIDPVAYLRTHGISV